jgi:hypothetical protein
MSNTQWGSWVWVKWKPGTPSTAWEGWKGHSSVQSAWSTLGDWDCCLWVNAKTPDELEEFVWKTVRHNTWVQDTMTTWAKKWW